ncbi:excalibur calcium-binding domain-containing protein [Streptomyces sp. NPDC050287]|uniref:excalibur calcium-binding domain-containing protein n=1 Tax=Streptomyces sp. NPDC050287 TaxID=3365608 RepID=UPI0037BBDAC3
MTNPYTPAPVPPTVSRPAPKWARKRYLFPALGLAFFLGIGAGASGEDPKTTDVKTTDAKPAAAKPQPTVTVTATATATVTAPAKAPEPAPTVTATKTVKVTRTVTARPAAGSGSDDSGSSDANVSYANCSEVRAAGAAPIYRGEPGYASHLDRDNDGIACDT